MIETAVDALLEATEHGERVTLDGFCVNSTDDGYTVTTPETEREEVSEADIREVTREQQAYVTNWYFWTHVAPGEDGQRAFLRWLENADEHDVPERYDALRDGITSSWGQLHVTVERDESGHRQYELRHEDDADADSETLDRYEDPFEARQLAKFDERDRYRPLKTAPTLQTGWIFVGLTAEQLIQAVDFFYPATIANWHREREGTLDVTHWDEHVNRQTGIFGLVKTWNRGEGYEHANWVAEACCVDSQCIKRREWEYDDEQELDVPGGDGVFPCREPCSVVLSAARQWTKLEAEQPQTYEFELTPSEKEQIEAIIDAVAEGRADEIREADIYDGANRYRTRFLRAKLFDDDGNLCGVPTDDDTEEKSQ